MTAATFTESYARRKLDKLDACKYIHVYQADDETAVCIHDGLRLTESDGGRLIHDPDEIRLLRKMAGDGWPHASGYDHKHDPNSGPGSDQCMICGRYA